MKKIFKISLAILTLAFLTVASSQNAIAQITWYVDDDNCPGPGSGSMADPFCSIQDAIDVAISGDTVLVAAGTYSPTTGEAFPISMKNGVSLVGAGADVCILDAENTNIVIYCSGISDTTTKIEGFTITNGSGSVGGGIYCNHSSPIITRNFLTGNRANGYRGGGGICCYWSSPVIIFNTITGNSSHYSHAGGITCWIGSPIIVNNIITENSSVRYGAGGGIYCVTGSPKIINNVISRNYSSWNGGGVFSWSSTAKITNNIITNNTAGIRGGGIYHSGGWQGHRLTITYTNVWGNTHNYEGCGPGTGCISADPLFVDLTAGDYHIQSVSPCIDAGDNFAPGLPEFDFDGNPRIINGIVDMGAFEYLGVIEVSTDIKPGSCPNPLNLKSKGVLTVAVLGAEDFDVTTIDPETILITQEDYEDTGVAPIRWSYEYVATPFEGEPCDCHDLNSDGYLDLTLKFKTQELVETLWLDLEEIAGETIPLILTGNLKEEEGGMPIIGSDCIKIQ